MLGAIAVAALVLPLADEARAQTIDGPTVAWNHSTWGKRRSALEGMEKVSELVKARTGGKFTIKIGYGEMFSKDKENLDAIKIGAVQMADFCNFYHPGKNPAWMVMSLPFLPLEDLEMAKEVREAMMKHPAFVADMDKWSAIAYLSLNLPQYEFLGKGKPPQKLEDWKGLRVRAGGGIGEAMGRLGATLSTVPATEVYTAIERGTLDAASFPFTYAHAAYQIHTVTSWFTSNLSPGTAECAAVINKEALAKLPEAYRKLLWDVKEEAYKALNTANTEIDKVNLPLFRSKLKEVTFTKEELKKFEEVAGKPVWDKWVADNKDKLDSKGVFETLQAEIAKAQAKRKKG
jgi:TRAP-type mannitol/chloroaromatic compound transport system substrate-binding protein